MDYFLPRYPHGPRPFRPSASVRFLATGYSHINGVCMAQSIHQIVPIRLPVSKCRYPPEPKKMWSIFRGRGSSLKATCGLSRRAVSETVILGGIASCIDLLAVSMPVQAAMQEPDVIRYKKLDTGVKLEDVVEGEGPEAQEGDLVKFNYVCRRANGYFVHSTVDQFSGESKPVTLPLSGEEMIRGLKDVLIGMKVGGKRRALIPPEVGYINETLQPIPEEFGPRRSLLSHAKEPLVFEVQLLKIM
ncbi:hypothetical protein ACP4OV_009335 [Aristida adscensionis]